MTSATSLTVDTPGTTSAGTTSPWTSPGTSPGTEGSPSARAAAAHAPIPFRRLAWVELTKMFDTRSGFWLLAGIAISALLATAAVVAFAPEESQTFEQFSAAIGMPIAILLPMVAILSVTAEWSQRGTLTTFTLVPHRGRVLLAKAVCAVGVGVVSMGVALAIGALGNVVGTAISGAPTVWDVDAANLATIVLANVLGLMMGFTLGVVLRSSPVAVVGYFVFSLVLPNALFALGMVQEWFADLQPWVDFYFSYTVLFEDVPTGEQWAQIGTSGLLWLVLPLAFGVWRVTRTEVK
ncbi:ABC transporter permease subunit [Nocardioides solisilvae]|uniref:ABC transporter permease subunit n=1 Tax=Nocardioides solisilvae TaxID=1542435 RepID=UPI000D743BF9|nr:ABC transporter permease subunit [Nocardioides solisilvae]